jgi:hypothetical protein
MSFLRSRVAVAVVVAVSVFSSLVVPGVAQSCSSGTPCCKIMRDTGFIVSAACDAAIVTDAIASGTGARPAIWYTTSQASTVVTSAASGVVKVINWNDASGNNKHLPGVTNKEPYKETDASDASKSYVRFGRVTANDASNNRVFQTATFASSIPQPFTVMTKMKFFTTTTGLLGYLMDGALDKHAAGRCTLNSVDP